jgi:peptidoglycan/xylan/chitin deacetylase (PgdA/CDA1 family)
VRADHIPILLYHGVVGGRAAGFDVSLDDFRRHMEAVVASGRSPERISDLVARSRTADAVGPSPVAITFDDGTADFCAAWEVLEEYGLSATLYVTSSAVGDHLEGRPMASWQQLRDLRDGGVEIGSHAHHHVALDLLDEDRVALELVNSKLVLEDRLGSPVDSFAYPYGYHTRAVKQLVRRAGYTSACAVKNALSHPGDDPFALARSTVTAATKVEAIEQLLAGRGAPRSWTGERARTRLWRSYRRARRSAQRSPGNLMQARA